MSKKVKAKISDLTLKDFYKDGYKEKLKEAVLKHGRINFYDEYDRVTETIDIAPIIEQVFKSGWEAYRALILEASYL